MNRKEAEELSPFIKAFGEGKDIEMRSKNPHAQLNGLAKMDEFIFGNFEYRIKPEPKYRPFKDAEECWQEMQKHQPFGWIKCEEGCFNIVYVTDEYVGLADPDGSSILLASKNSYQDNTFADGVPFGVKVEK